MATAKLTMKDKEVVVRTKVNTIVLELSDDEALAIYTLFMKTGGSPTASSRKFTANILAALDSADSTLGDRFTKKFGRYGEKNLLTGSFMFNDII